MNSYIDITLVANITVCFLMLTIIMNKHGAILQSGFCDKLFYSMVIMTMIQAVLETVEFYVDGVPGTIYIVINYATNTVTYIVSVLFGYIWTVYADYRVLFDKKRILKIYPFVAIPAVIMIIAIFINLFTPVFYSISADNCFSRTKLAFIPYLVSFFYLIYGVVVTLVHRKDVHRYMFFPAVVFTIPIFFFSILQYKFYGVSLIWLGVSLGVTNVYMNMRNETSYVDALSGLYNRHYFNKYVIANLRQTKGGRRLAGIMLDLDQFKEVNDTLGHQTGDDAIHEAGKMLIRLMNKRNVRAFRYAGDEFVILFRVENEEEINEYIDVIREKENEFNNSSGKPYKLLFSMGYTISYGAEDSYNKFLKRLDTQMYIDKKRRAELRGTQIR